MERRSPPRHAESTLQIGADNQFGRDFGNPDPTTQGTIVRGYTYALLLLHY